MLRSRIVLALSVLVPVTMILAYPIANASQDRSIDPTQVSPQEQPGDQDQVDSRYIMIFYDPRSPDLAHTLTWAHQIAQACDKANIPWFKVDVQSKKMTNNHTAHPNTPVDPGQLPQWLLDHFAPSFKEGTVILQAYGRKNGSAVRHSMIGCAGSIVGPGRYVRGFFDDDIAQFIKEVTQAPASAWVDVAQTPNKFISSAHGRDQTAWESLESSRQQPDSRTVTAEQAQTPAAEPPVIVAVTPQEPAPPVTPSQSTSTAPVPVPSPLPLPVAAPPKRDDPAISLITDGPDAIANKEISMQAFTDFATLAWIMHQKG